MNTILHFVFPVVLVVVFSFFSRLTFGQEVPKGMLETSLKLRPTQQDVDIDVPAEEEAARCNIDFYDGRKGYIVTSPQNVTLRLFLDQKGDSRINQWSYFKNGIEVYRDVDTDGNGSADQFRWLNTAGTRHGVDTDGDYIVDYWKSISPEEVSQEIVRALATGDLQRFLRVTLGQDELKHLELGQTLNETLAKKIAALENGFNEAVKAVGLGREAQWYQLNAVLPGLVPAGDRGNKKDLVVYENAWTTVGDGKETKQIALGTLVKVGDNNWRTIDSPKIYDENHVLTTFIPFGGVPMTTGPVDNEAVALINQYQTLVNELPQAKDRAGQYKEIVLLMLKIIAGSPTQEDRELWVRLMVDTIMEAVQENALPDGGEQLDSIYETFQKLGNEELAAYIRYRQIMVEFYTDMHAKKNDVKTYTNWLENLEKLVESYEKTETGIEAMMQLAINKEMTARSPEEPLKWYEKIVQVAGGRDGTGKMIAEKAKGAVRRLTSTGRAVPFKSSDLSGNSFDIASLKGTPVLLCFWDSRTADELTPIKKAVDELAASGLRVVGINLDTDPNTMRATAAKLGWAQLYMPGGLDGPNAVYWGVQSTPYMILYGKDGTVANPNVLNADDLKEEIAGLSN